MGVGLSGVAAWGSVVWRRGARWRRAGAGARALLCGVGLGGGVGGGRRAAARRGEVGRAAIETV
jgi:hypothetical protein